MKEILIKLEEFYKKRFERQVRTGTCIGLCGMAKSALNLDDYLLFKDYLNKFTEEKNQTVFYTYENIETESRDQFVWKPKDPQPRLEWLTEHIQLNS